MLTVDEFKEALPPQMKKAVNQELIDSINTSLNDPDILATYAENLISYTSVLQCGKFKIENYLNAVKYVGFKVMGLTSKAAYAKTFPKKYTTFLARNVKEKDIASYVTAYNKSKLVNLIFEQTLIPSYILNASVFQKAINHQAHLMLNAKSEKVQQDAANSLLTHLKPPEKVKMELDIAVKSEGSIIDTYQQAMRSMVEQQLKLIENGGDTKQIANAPIRLLTPVDPEDVLDITPEPELQPLNLFA
jgi:hypothetical protein